MGHAVSHNRLLYRALLASLALHLVLLALIPPLANLESAQNIELLSFVRIQTVRIATPVPRPERRAAAPVRAAVVSAASAPVPVRRPLSQRSTRPSQLQAGAPIVASAVRGGGVTAAPSTVAVPASAAPQNAPDETSRQPVGGYEPLGVNDTPVLDPAVRKALLALGVHVTLTITVDGNGHTKHVAFAPPLDPSVEQQIQALLAAASWDPAVCGGGMTCEGQATITL
jgi:hypothetical protein